MKKRMLALSGLLVAALPLLAETGTVGTYTYNYIDNGDGTATLSRYDADGYWVDEPISPLPVGEFMVPGEIDGKKVVAIGDSYFDDCRQMTSVVIPASVTNITVHVCINLPNITNVTIAADNPVYKSVDGILYTKDGKMLVACPCAKGGDIVVEEGTERIGHNAFHGNNPLLSIVIPDSVKVIERYAFYYCGSLAGVTLPASLKVIEDYAFGNCSALAIVTFAGAEGDIDISDTAFVGTPYDAMKPFSLIIDEYGNLIGIHGAAPENLILADYLNGQELTGIADNALSAGNYNTASVTNIVVPEGVTWIGTYAFVSDAALASVTLPNTLQRICWDAFGGCTSLRAIRIPPAVTCVDNAFYGCTNLTVKAPSTLRDTFSVPEEDGCRIEHYEVPQHTVTFNANGGTVGGAATTIWTIYEGRRLDSVDEYYDLPMPALNGYAFLGWFTAAEGGDEVTADMVVTGDMTLYAHWEEITYTYNYIDNGDGTVTLSCYDVNGYWVGGVSPAPVGEFTVPDMIDGKRVVAIDVDVFNNGGGLTSLVIPASVTNLTTYAFNRSYDLTNIAVAADNPVYKSVDGFLYMKDGKTLVACPYAKGGDIVVAEGTEKIGTHAFNGNCFIESVTFPSDLKQIGEYAFSYCQNENFTSVTIPASVENIGAYAFGNCSYLATVTFAGAEGDVDIADTAFIATPYDAAKPFSLIVDEWGYLVGIHGVARENLVLADYLNGQELTGIADNALSAGNYNTASVTNIVVPEGVTWIGYSAFASDAALASVTLPTSLQSIGYGAFSYCTSLRAIRIPPAVTYVDNAFYGCTNLTVTAPSTMRDTFSVPDEDGCRIEYYDVPECTVMFDANGGTIDGEAIAEMTVLQGRTLDNWPRPYREGYDFAGWFDPDGKRMQDNFVVTEDVTFTARWREPSPWSYDPCYQGEDGEQIGVFVMGAERIVVTNGVLTIPAILTALNDNGEEVEMPVVGIRSYAFEEWDQVDSLVLPESVKMIGEFAFGWCSSLTNVTFLGNRELIDMDIRQVFAQTPWLDAQPFTWMTSEEDGEVYLNGFYGSPVPDDTLVIPAGVTAMSPSALPYWYTVSDGDGYRRFLGWYTAAEGGVQADAGRWNGEVVEIAGGTTLYARWEAAEPEWSFDVEDDLAIITGNAVLLVGDVEMPATVTVEEEDGEGNVTDVSYPVVAIGEGALSGMEITSVTIPASVTNICDRAFEDCGNLTNVVFAGGMENVEMRVLSAFCGTPWLEAYLASLPAPENDDLAAAAQIVGVSGRTTGTNMGAGIEDGEPLDLSFDSTATVWWRWTAPTNGSFMFTTQGSSFDTVMGVYTGTAVDSLVMVAEDDDHGPDSTSAVAFDAVAGTTYYIAVAGFAENVGDIALSWDVDKGVIVEAGDNIVAENGDGSYTITAPVGGELTEDDVDGIEVKARLDGGWIYTTEGYDVVFGGGVITVSLKKPEVNTDIYPAAKDPDDKSGFLVDPEVVTVAAEPDVREGETLGALPVKAVPGLWYRASWGDSLHGMTTGEAVQADDPELYLGVIRQDGASGFYKVSVSDHAQ